MNVFSSYFHVEIKTDKVKKLFILLLTRSLLIYRKDKSLCFSVCFWSSVTQNLVLLFVFLACSCMALATRCPELKLCSVIQFLGLKIKKTNEAIVQQEPPCFSTGGVSTPGCWEKGQGGSDHFGRVFAILNRARLLAGR